MAKQRGLLSRRYRNQTTNPEKTAEAEDPFANYGKYEERVQTEANKYMQQAEEARKKGREEAQNLLNNPPEGLTESQRQNMRNQRQVQIDRDLANYSRMLSGQQGVRGVRGGVTAAAQRDLQNAAQDRMAEYERDLSDLDTSLAMKKLAAIYGAGESEAAQNALLNQSAYDKIIGYLQNESQRKLYEDANRKYRGF
jgi:hypothetical protein